ncbi:hypothetical protein PSPO01_09147 [Paraphaeosphaeria sporulosa]
MGFVSKIKSAFGSKSHREPKQSEVVGPAEEIMFPAQLTRVGPAQTALPDRHWTQSREVDCSDYRGNVHMAQAPYQQESSITESSGHSSGFEGVYIAALREMNTCVNDFSQKYSDASDMAVSFGLFAPRELGYRPGHVEELDSFELKRSNALRRKTTASRHRRVLSHGCYMPLRFFLDRRDCGSRGWSFAGCRWTCRGHTR